MSVLIKKILLSLLLCVVTLPAMAQKTILVLGDSLSAAYGLQQSEGWVTLLQQRLNENHYNYKVVNASISGDTTSNGLARLPALLEQTHPAVTIVELGGNDGLRGIPLTVIKSNLSQIVTLLKAAHSQVLVVGIRLPPNYGPEYTQQFQKLFIDVAAKHAVSVVPLLLKNVDQNQQLFQADGVHPLPVAEPVMLDNVWPSLKGMLTH